MEIEKLMNTLHLGKLVEEPVAVSGGLLHKMYCVSTTDGIFAVKVLNSEIMKRADALSNMVNSERVAKAFGAIVPAIVSLEINQRQIQELEGNYYFVFPWIDGASVFPNEITPHHCEAIGDILGKMHRRNLLIEGIIPEEDSFEMFDWETYLQQINELKNSDEEWVLEYRESIQDIICWNQKACDSEKYLSERAVISHRDLDPKNVMWNGDKPYIIDWEAAGYVNPYQEFLEVVNYWADDGMGKLKKEKFDALTRAYCRYMDIKTVVWDEVFHGSYIGMLGWLEYNIKRALGIEASDEDERHLGEQQVLGTLRDLYSYQAKIEQLEEWLGYGENRV